MTAKPRLSATECQITMDQPFVTVTTPHYNSPKFIGECIESVLSLK